jgi:hypothetical protein
MSRSARVLSVLSVVALAAACTDTTASDNMLDVGEKTALSGALTTSGALSATPLASLASLLVGTLNATGSLATADNANAFEAVGIEIVYDVTKGVTHTVGTFTGVVGWSGLSTASNSVDALIEAVIATNTSSPLTGTVAVNSVPTVFPAAEAFYGARNATGTYTTYIGATGNVNITAADFSGTNTDCSGGVTGISCNVSAGTVSGSFTFGGVGITNPLLSYSQPNTTFTTLPAVKIQITVTQ